jgi:hypothetical protein
MMTLEGLLSMLGKRKEIIMSKFDFGERRTKECPKGSTHVLKSSFADPGSDTQAVTGLFCYNQNLGTGAFFAIGKKALGDHCLHKVGNDHRFVRRWTHIVHIPILSATSPLPHTYNLLLFYDAASGTAEVYATDGNGNLNLRKRYRGWRTYWTQIIGGQFGKANLIFYDAVNRAGAFYTLNKSGDIQFIEDWS